MKLTTKELLRLGEATLFKMKVFQLKNDQSISLRQMAVIVLLHFLIIAEAICYNFQPFEIVKIPMESIVPYILYTASGITLFYACLLLISMGLTSRIKVHEQLPPLIIFTSHLLHVFEHVILPLNIWAFIYCLLKLNKPVIFASVGAPSIFIGLVCISVSDLFLKCTMPSNSPFGCLQVKYIFFQNILMKILITVGVLGKYTANIVNRTIFQVATVFLALILFSLMAMKPAYWKVSANKMYLTFYGGVLLLSIWNIPVNISHSQAVDWIPLILAFGFLPRIVEPITRRQETVELFNPKESFYKKLRCLLLVTNLFDKCWRREMDNNEKLTLHKFKLQMEDRAKKTNKPREELELAYISCGRLAQFLAEEGEEYVKSYDMAKFELLARLMSPSDNILKAFISLLRFKKLVGEGILARLEARFFDMMFEARLQAFYYLRPEEKTSQETVIENLFKNYIISAEQNISTRVADICVPLNHKTLFLRMREKIYDVIDNRNRIYKYILSKANSNAHMMSFDLYTFNHNEKVKVGDTKALINSEFKPIKLPPSYFFPSMFVLNSLVYHDTVKSRKILRTFKKNLLAWEFVKAREQSLRLDVLDVHSAVLQVSLQQHDRGRIVDGTPNWPIMLGEIENGGSIVGHNVNDMFIDILSKKHAVMMNNTFGLTRILNIKRDFYIKTFTNELKAIIFTLRLWPSLEKDLTGVVALGPSGTQRLGQNMLLMTPEMDIIQAEEGFWSNIGKGDNGQEMKNVLEITVKLQIVNKLLGIFEGFMAEAETFHIQDEVDTPLEAIYKLGKVLLKLNMNCSLIYRVDENTNFTHNLKGTPLLCKMNIVEFMDVVLSQLFVRFGVRDIENGSIKKSKAVESQSAFETQLLRSMTTNPSGEVNNTIENMINDENKNYMNNMTLKEKLKIWNEEEKPTEVDIILAELFKWIGKADEADVRLCPTTLKKYLIRFGDVVNQFRESLARRGTFDLSKGGSFLKAKDGGESLFKNQTQSLTVEDKVVNLMAPKKPEIQSSNTLKVVKQDLPSFSSHSKQESIEEHPANQQVEEEKKSVVYFSELADEDEEDEDNQSKENGLKLDYNSRISRKSGASTPGISKKGTTPKSKVGSRSSKGSKKKKVPLV